MDRDEPREPRREGPPRSEGASPGRGPQGAPRSPDADRPRGAERPHAKDEEQKASQWERTEKRRRTGLTVRLVVGLTLLVLFVIFVLQNSDPVPVRFIFTETRTPLVWVFLVCALVGGLVAYLLGKQGRRSSRKYIKELERKLEERGNKR